MHLLEDRRGTIIVDHLIISFVNLVLGFAIIGVLGPSILASYQFTQMVTLMPVP